MGNRCIKSKHKPNLQNSIVIQYEEDNSEKFFRILLLGNSGVGKTCILTRLTSDEFSMIHVSTVGVDYKTVTFQIDQNGNTVPVKLQIWDTAERFQSITQAYYRGAHGVILIFDLTDRQSFKDIHRWLGDVNKHSHEETRLLLVGNKRDLVDARAVNYDEAQKLATKIGTKYFETSAKEGNVQFVFEQIAKELLNK